MKELFCFKMVSLTQYVPRQLICTSVQVGVSCTIIVNGCDLTIDYDKDVSLRKD